MWADVVYEINGKKVFLLSFWIGISLKLISSLCFSLNDLLTFENQQACLLAESLKGEEPSFCIFFAVSRKGLLAFDN